jgi:hypothetical protein
MVSLGVSAQSDLYPSYAAGVAGDLARAKTWAAVSVEASVRADSLLVGADVAALSAVAALNL